jgi:hypothetical protein
VCVVCCVLCVCAACFLSLDLSLDLFVVEEKDKGAWSLVIPLGFLNYVHFPSTLHVSLSLSLQILVATGNSSQLLLVVGGRTAVFLEISAEALTQVKYVRGWVCERPHVHMHHLSVVFTGGLYSSHFTPSLPLFVVFLVYSHKEFDSEISCVDLTPCLEESHSAICALGFWDVTLRLFRLSDWEMLASEELGGDAHPCSVLMSTIQSQSYLMCAVGDGHLFNFIFDPVCVLWW